MENVTMHVLDVLVHDFGQGEQGSIFLVGIVVGIAIAILCFCVGWALTCVSRTKCGEGVTDSSQQSNLCKAPVDPTGSGYDSSSSSEEEDIEVPDVTRRDKGN